MNLEQITQPIEAESSDDREMKIAERLARLQVHFADSRHQDGRYADFSEALNKNTTLISSLLRRYYENIRGEKEEERDKKVKSFAASVDEEINKLYRETPDREKRDEVITQHLLGLYSTIKKREPDEIEKRMDEDLNIGAIKVERDVREKKSMEEAGFDPEDEFVTIHFPSFYESASSRSPLVEVGKSFSKLAEIIPQKYPEARAIISESWLLSLPAAERLGFKKVFTPAAKPETNLARGGIWSQFIDQNGNISKKRFDEFMKTGKPPYAVTLGYIPVEEFLGRYLPAGKKGEILLKEINPDWKREDAIELEKCADEIQEIHNDFQSFVEDTNSSAEDFMKNYPAFVSVMTKAGCYEDFLKVIAKAKEKGYRFSEIARKMPFENAKMGIAYEKYRKGLESKKYRDRKVFIE